MSDKTITYQNPEDTQKMYIIKDVRRWKEEIEIINVELNFYKNLLLSKLNGDGRWNSHDYKQLFEDISAIGTQNRSFQSRFATFNNKLSGIEECEDLQCEIFFLNQHKRFKDEIEAHFSEYKIFKKGVFQSLKTKYDY